MGKRYLIDTNVISHLFSERLPEAGSNFVKAAINEEFIISVVVEIDILTFHEIPGKMLLIEEFVALATILPLDEKVTRRAVELRRNYRKIKLGDSIIAATALVHNLGIISNNVKDFRNIAGLTVVDPYKL